MSQNLKNDVVKHFGRPSPFEIMRIIETIKKKADEGFLSMPPHLNPDSKQYYQILCQTHAKKFYNKMLHKEVIDKKTGKVKEKYYAFYPTIYEFYHCIDLMFPYYY